ncbi:MAG TPA: HhH-GPD-type base excision DNA repair protein [Candidatus Saccharimonadales bacterium]|nr:HhH-GPD-type base excision DNA repair protein [Candidatus Saccharimonadales bacterium]
MTATTDRLPFTGDEEADRLLISDPLAMLIGFALDQQVTVQKAFSGPLELRRRVGHLDAARLAAMDPAELDRVFRTPPALHRFPGSMAGKVQALAAAIATDYGGDASRLWTEAADGPDLKRRLLGLPGFGEMKVAAILSILSRRYGIDLPGLAAVLPTHPTLGDVDSAEALASYQAGKRAKKAELRAAKG